MRLARFALVASVLLTSGCPKTAPPPPPPPPAEVPKVVEPRAPVVTYSEGVEYRQIVAPAVVFIPKRVRLIDGAYDLVVHFHGPDEVVEKNLNKVGLSPIVVTINAGVGSDAYSSAYGKAGAWGTVLHAIDFAKDKSQRADLIAAHAGHIALSSWSAGWGGVAGLMKDPEVNPHVDALLLADGIFTSWEDEKKKTIKQSPIQFLWDYAALATRNERLLAITHTYVMTYGYPGVPDITAVLLSSLGLEAGPPGDAYGRATMIPTYQVKKGSFSVVGYKGISVRDHVNQIHSMNLTIYPALAKRWHAEPAPP